MIDPKLKSDWLTALRSGEYRQGREAIVSDRNYNGEGYEYCCLGVLCAVAGYSRDQLLNTDDNLVHDKTDWYKFDPILGPINPAVKRELVRMNDDELATFDTIADFIENNGDL